MPSNPDLRVVTGAPLSGGGPPAGVKASRAIPVFASNAGSDMGRVRQNNEDYFVCDDQFGLYIVCDGMGGHSDGEVASREAATRLAEVLQSHVAAIRAYDGSNSAKATVQELVTEAIREASRRVSEVARASRGGGDMGTTLTMLLLLGDTGLMGHVGDSRLYLCRGGAVHQLSSDHTVYNELLSKGPNAPNPNHPSANVLTRVMGQSQWLQPDTLLFDIVPGDTLMLCSDGLSGVLESNDELSSYLSNDSLDGISPALLRLANGRGGRDNITAIVVRALTEGLPDEDLDRTIEMAGHFDAFCRVRLLQGLNHIDLLRLRYAFDEKPFRRGDVIVEEGEIRGLVIIVDGITEVLRGGQSLGNIEPGGFFGEAGLITERESPATIGALTEGLALEMSEQEFDELNRSEPVLANALLRNLSMVLIQRLDRASGR